ncbi:MAG: hypothetical protein ABID54_09310 [Pseudomonadota bacterium]
MDILIGNISPVEKDPSKENVPTLVGKRQLQRDRRRNKQDRRTSVREGIFVSLSGSEDRRVLRDRRKASS